jgi:hypothetical protein
MAVELSAPAPPRVDALAMRLRHSYRIVRQDWPKLSLLRDRQAHAHIVTMQQSGTHWLTHMLCAALAEVYGLPELADIDDRRLIGDHKRPAVHSHIPRLIQTHNIPSPLCHAWPLRVMLRFPRYVLLLRDIRASLVSHYEKHHARSMTFAAYLRNRRIIANSVRWDLWYRVRFLNAWDRETRRLRPDQVLVMRYEEIQASPQQELQRLWKFLALPAAADAVFSRAVAVSTKERMSARESPDKGVRVIRRSCRHPFEWFDVDDREYLESVCAAYLRNTFGYDYNCWSDVLPSARPITPAAA